MKDITASIEIVESKLCVKCKKTLAEFLATRWPDRSKTLCPSCQKIMKNHMETESDSATQMADIDEDKYYMEGRE